MAVRALRAEGDDNLRLYPAKVNGDFFDRFSSVDLIKPAVRIIEQPHFSETQLFGRRPQLRLTQLSDDVGSRRLFAVAEAATLASGCCNKVGRHSLAGVFCQR